MNDLDPEYLHKWDVYRYMTEPLGIRIGVGLQQHNDDPQLAEDRWYQRHQGLHAVDEAVGSLYRGGSNAYADDGRQGSRHPRGGGRPKSVARSWWIFPARAGQRRSAHQGHAGQTTRELMQLCYNAGSTIDSDAPRGGGGFAWWWEHYGRERHNTFALTWDTDVPTPTIPEGG